jgi:tetratricopeptide (TPR) repeat protein
MRQLLPFIFSVVFLFLSSQTPLAAQFSKANSYFSKKEYAKAIPYFEQGLKKKESLNAKTRLAQCYQILNRMVMAESLLSEIVTEPKAKPISFRHYAEVLMSNGKYALATHYLEQYQQLVPDDATTQQLISSCLGVQTMPSYFKRVQMEFAPFNSEGDDNTAVFGPKGLVFTSDRTEDRRLLKRKSGATGRDYLKLWASSPTDTAWSEATHFSSRVNDLNVNTAGISYSADGQTIAFSRNNTVTSKKGEYKMQLFTSTINKNGRVSRTEKMDFCNDELNYMHPTLSANGEVVIFSCDSRGEGGMDLFISYKRKNKWSVPRNLGSIINTSAHEAFPYLHHDGSLYFASKGHIGFGGFDLFVAKYDSLNELWSKPVNIGQPINSPSDDMSLVLTKGDTIGTFTSNRARGNDDIYFFWTASKPNWNQVFQPQPQAKPQINEDIAPEIEPPIDSLQSTIIAQIDQLLSIQTPDTCHLNDLKTGLASLSNALLPCHGCKAEILCQNADTAETLAGLLDQICETSSENIYVSVVSAPTEDGKSGVTTAPIPACVHLIMPPAESALPRAPKSE